jgi:hypothetical protein
MERKLLARIEACFLTSPRSRDPPARAMIRLRTYRLPPDLAGFEVEHLARIDMNSCGGCVSAALPYRYIPRF